MRTLVSLTGKANPGAKELAAINLDAVDSAAVMTSLDIVRQQYDRLGGTDKVAKGPSLRDAVRETLP